MEVGEENLQERGMTERQNINETIVSYATLRSPDAFADITRRCYSRVYFTALAVTGQAEMAEDIVQETFLRAWLKRDTVKDPAMMLQPWLIRIARNLAIDWLRSGQTKSYAPRLLSPDCAHSRVTAVQHDRLQNDNSQSSIYKL